MSNRKKVIDKEMRKALTGTVVAITALIVLWVTAIALQSVIR